MNHLAAVAGSHTEEAVSFCSYCGRLEDDGQRVCSACGLGVRLWTDSEVLRSPGASFLVVCADGTVSAASQAAERQLRSRGGLVGRHVTALLGSPDLPHAVARAAAGEAGPTRMTVERMAVTVVPCGLPPAALVVLE